MPAFHDGSGPIYELACRSASGEPVRLRYAPHASELTDGDGAPLLGDVRPFEYASVDRIAPDAPGWKSREVDTLKIQLGLGCNYNCSYCNQASAAAGAPVTRTADAERFLAALDQWLVGAPQRIEFWGGEPLVYFAKLQRLVPELRRRFPAAVLFMVTNGSLLDEEVIGFIERWDLHVAVSHDGPGQALRDDGCQHLLLHHAAQLRVDGIEQLAQGLERFIEVAFREARLCADIAHGGEMKATRAEDLQAGVDQFALPFAAPFDGIHAPIAASRGLAGARFFLGVRRRVGHGKSDPADLA